MVRIERQSPDHAPGLFAALSDRRTYAFLDGRVPASVEAVRKRIDRLRRGAPSDSGETWLNWTVFDEDEVVGYTQATIAADGTADIAYVLHPDAWGRSIGYQACQLTLDDLSADPAVRQIVADTDAGNRRSQVLLERLGFQRARVEGEDIFYELGDPVRGT